MKLIVIPEDRFLFCSIDHNVGPRLCPSLKSWPDFVFEFDIPEFEKCSGHLSTKMLNWRLFNVVAFFIFLGGDQGFTERYAVCSHTQQLQGLSNSFVIFVTERWELRERTEERWAVPARTLKYRLHFNGGAVVLIRSGREPAAPAFCPGSACRNMIFLYTFYYIQTGKKKERKKNIPKHISPGPGDETKKQVKR